MHPPPPRPGPNRVPSILTFARASSSLSSAISSTYFFRRVCRGKAGNANKFAGLHRQVISQQTNSCMHAAVAPGNKKISPQRTRPPDKQRVVSVPRSNKIIATMHSCMHACRGQHIGREMARKGCRCPSLLVRTPPYISNVPAKEKGTDLTMSGLQRPAHATPNPKSTKATKQFILMVSPVTDFYQHPLHLLVGNLVDGSVVLHALGAVGKLESVVSLVAAQQRPRYRADDGDLCVAPETRLKQPR